MPRRLPELDEKRLHVRDNIARTGVDTLCVRDVMSTRIVTARPDSTVSDMLQTFEAHRIEHLLVVQDGRLVGSISDRDVARIFSSEDIDDVRRFEALRAKDLMNPSPERISADTSLPETASQMVERGVHCLAVTEDDRPLGVVTTTDLLLVMEARGLSSAPSA